MEVEFLNKRIIAIDDEELIRELFLYFFQLYNFTNFQIYYSAENFLKSEGANIVNVDFLITDYFLGGMDGFNLAKYIKLELGLNIPILILTATDNSDAWTNLTEFADYISSKPFHLEDLLEILRMRLIHWHGESNDFPRENRKENF